MTFIARAAALFMMAAVLVTGLCAGTGTAAAEVYVDADSAIRGGETVLTFRVPSNADTRERTTRVTVALPDLASATAELTPGWTARLDRDRATGAIRAVTWTAAPGGGVKAGRFGLFRLAVTLPNAPKLSFPVIQTYSDGTVVRWDQPPLPGAEIEHPTPTLRLARSPTHFDHATPSPAAAIPPAAAGDLASSRENPGAPARTLALAGLLVGAVVTGVWLSMRRQA